MVDVAATADTACTASVVILAVMAGLVAVSDTVLRRPIGGNLGVVLVNGAAVQHTNDRTSEKANL